MNNDISKRKGGLVITRSLELRKERLKEGGALLPSHASIGRYPWTRFQSKILFCPFPSSPSPQPLFILSPIISLSATSLHSFPNHLPLCNLSSFLSCQALHHLLHPPHMYPRISRQLRVETRSEYISLSHCNNISLLANILRRRLSVSQRLCSSR